MLVNAALQCTLSADFWAPGCMAQVVQVKGTAGLQSVLQTQIVGNTRLQIFTLCSNHWVCLLRS
jgi:hypothetical protein